MYKVIKMLFDESINDFQASEVCCSESYKDAILVANSLNSSSLFDFNCFYKVKKV